MAHLKLGGTLSAWPHITGRVRHQGASYMAMLCAIRLDDMVSTIWPNVATSEMPTMVELLHKTYFVQQFVGANVEPPCKMLNRDSELQTQQVTSQGSRQVTHVTRCLDGYQRVVHARISRKLLLETRSIYQVNKRTHRTKADFQSLGGVLHWFLTASRSPCSDAKLSCKFGSLP